MSGADIGFQVRGGALKKITPSGGRRENCWGISCETSRFYAKKIIFFPIAEGGANIFGVFRVKNHDFTPTNHIFSNFRGGARRVRLPLDPPLLVWEESNNKICLLLYFSTLLVWRLLIFKLMLFTSYRCYCL